MPEPAYTAIAAKVARERRKPPAKKATAASAGLAAAIARGSNPKAAFRGLSTAQIVAAMTDDQRAELAASLSASTPKQSAVEAARAQAFADETARGLAVLSSPEVIGRAALASQLLSNPKLTAADIIALMANSARDNTASEDPDPMLAAADMRRLLEEGAQAADASGDDDSLVDNMRARWSDIHAEVAAERAR